MVRRLLVLTAAAASISSCTQTHSPDADTLDGAVPIVCGEIAVCPVRYWPDGGRLLPYCSISCDAAAGYDPPICRGSEVPDAEVPWAPYCPSGATPFCAPPRPDRCGE